MSKNKNINLADCIVATPVQTTFDNGLKKIVTVDKVYILDSYEGMLLGDKRVCKATDYACLCGANINYKGESLCFYRESLGDDLVGMQDFSEEQVAECDPNFLYGTIRPAMNLDIEKLRKSGIDLNIRGAKSGNYQYGTLQFGSFPKTYVDGALNIALEMVFQKGKMQPTGKEYIGAYEEDASGRITRGYNYEYTNPRDDKRKFVRVLTGDNDPLWVRVEPITWMITNWEDLPTDFNPKGTNTAKVINVVAEESIIGGVPFHNEYIANIDLWQNSTIRGYLNGINVNNIKINGNPEYSARGGEDFSKTSNFLTEALDMQMERVQEIQPQTIEKEKVKKMRKGYGVTIEDTPMSISDQLKFYINNKESFMLHGASGVGKTRRIEEIDPEYVAIVLRNGILPEEVIGKNIYPNTADTQSGKWVPPSWYVDLCKKCEKDPNKNHVLFIDEITNVRPYEQSLVYHLVLNNSIGPNYGKLPDNAVVVAAGNSKEESESAYNMPEPLFRRFAGHVYLPLDIPSWLEWGSEMVGKGEKKHTRIHPLVSNFVATFGKDVFHSEYDPENPPEHVIDPRGWEQVSDIIYKSKGKLARELIENKLGKKTASSFVEFAKNPPLNVEDIVEGNYSNADIPKKFDAKYALVLSLSRASKEDLPAVREFISDNLGGELANVFDKNWVGENTERAIYLSNIIKNKEEIKENKKETKENIQGVTPQKSIGDVLSELCDEYNKRFDKPKSDRFSFRLVFRNVITFAFRDMMMGDGEASYSELNNALRKRFSEYTFAEVSLGVFFTQYVYPAILPYLSGNSDGGVKLCDWCGMDISRNLMASAPDSGFDGLETNN